MSITNTFMVFEKIHGSTIWQHIAIHTTYDGAYKFAMSQPSTSRLVIIPCNEMVELVLMAMKTSGEIAVMDAY